MGLSPTFLKDSRIFIKLPKNTIPTFNSKHFKVFYVLIITIVKDDNILKFAALITLYNNNFSDFSFKEFCKLEIVKNEQDEYLLVKAFSSIFLLIRKHKNPQDFNEKSLKCVNFYLLDNILKIEDKKKLLEETLIRHLLNLNQMKNKVENLSNSHKSIFIEEPEIIGDKNKYLESLSRSTIPQNKEATNNNQIVKPESSSEYIENEFNQYPLLQKMLNSLNNPHFNSINVLTIDKSITKFQIVNEKKKMAIVSHSTFFHDNNYLIINYIENVKKTDLYKIYYEAENLIDAEIVFQRRMDTDGTIEKYIDLELKEFGIKTFIFEIKFSLMIYLDGFKISYDLPIIDPKAKISIKEI